METLNNNWITEKHTDLEYKQYILLAFLKKIEEQFKEQKIYPALEHLETEYQNLLHLKQAFSLLENKLSKNIKNIDIQSYKIVYHSINEDDIFVSEINAILDFALPKVEQLIEIGNKLLQQVEQKISIEGVGLMPLRLKEGYLFLSSSNTPEIKVYAYNLTIYEKSNEHFPGIKTQFIADYQKSLVHTFEHIKHDLIKKYNDLPNPAAYLVSSELTIPMEYTYLPLAKRKLAKHIN